MVSQDPEYFGNTLEFLLFNKLSLNFEHWVLGMLWSMLVWGLIIAG